MNKKESTVLITGASSGIGEATARLLGSMGMTVILLSRNEIKLQTITIEINKNGGQAEYYLLDVSSYSKFKDVVTSIIGKHRRIRCSNQ
ncbi:SDR family NAD(P)-dependent oxidoreductase [Oceanobacillus neutriphilus]|uniref:SDR family NAD(P)-dependent oxidoreductase n=1 Tax=Oceanobacillus neutriphilus TaxID=531815 RepID=A0ABQ2NVS0_9BACI|nr:SDR family NAD(P)-dependent oxidoreductase [Oceanobacillus neutriphilus]GGP11750.1 hypothetical protein GCM10011346_25000 [Oceanobacillus neutriphilus]